MAFKLFDVQNSFMEESQPKLFIFPKINKISSMSHFKDLTEVQFYSISQNREKVRQSSRTLYSKRTSIVAPTQSVSLMYWLQIWCLTPWWWLLRIFNISELRWPLFPTNTYWFISHTPTIVANALCRNVLVTGCTYCINRWYNLFLYV